ncbi:hypothetical protein LSH36_542g01001 [Paralvinella palmiformis]|uniref:Fibrinogen C-terminal domain-containing protein n=1 Tax=Paralvinella palmiformis TaxID=53620 RepID=A0AAD9MXE0_9ANNE|nr:hypothetical protein LSH36_542g01001 [Paralvinella palmiformis]
MYDGDDDDDDGGGDDGGGDDDDDGSDYDGRGLVVHIENVGLVPERRELLTDEFVDTCAAFNNENCGVAIPRHTQFRIEVADDINDYASVTLIGTNLGCGHNLYVSPLSAEETEKWNGRWTTCLLKEALMYESNEKCLYECQCRERCEEIQVMKYPKIIEDSSWTVCRVCIADPNKSSGIYTISPHLFIADCDYKPNVYCDMDTDGGGWTVIMRRMDGSVDFFREWEDYKHGFGSLEGEFWAGNELVYRLTNDGRTYKLRINMTAYDGQSTYVKYNSFIINSESNNYTFYAYQYDYSSTGYNRLESNDGCMFSTGSIDNDNEDSHHFTKEYQAPWWYCHAVYETLTGRFAEYSSNITSTVGMWWFTESKKLFVKQVVMMIRPN